jgi:putative NADH-flavin reductase
MQKKSEAGLGHALLIFLVVAVVAAVGLVGLRVKQNNSDKAGEVTATQPLAKVQAPDQISSKADLTKAEASLNQTNVDSDVNPDTLNSDVNNLL